MNIFMVLTFVCLGLASFTWCDEDKAAEEEVKDLIIETLVKPSECARAAAKNDMLEMHYTGSLLNGDVFDSR